VSTLLRLIYLLALALWVGEIVFFSFVVAPAVFRVLGIGGAGEVVGAIFPGYYALGMGAAAVAFACGLMLRAGAGTRAAWTGAVVAIGVGLAATVWAGAMVHPRAQRLRVAMHAAGEESPAGAAFRRAHQQAVALNGVALLAGLAGLGFTAAAVRH
jgi:hypothetical protein